MKTYNLENRKEIKEAYKMFYPGCSPYALWIDFCKYMSPIEFNVWSDIRSNGLMFYPQFPVLNYFIDFADPIRKIWIEVDWKDWHLDKEKDKIRQNKIENEWWKIYRVEWKHTYVNEFDYENEKYYDRPYKECEEEWFNELSEWEKKYITLIKDLKK